MGTRGNSNIKVGECIIYIQHDFQIEDFKEWMDYTIRLFKDDLLEMLNEAKRWVGHSTDSYTAKDVDEYIEHLDREYFKICSLQIESCKYIDNGNLLKLYIVYRYDIDFDNVVTFLSECIDLIYKKHLYDMKQQNNLKLKEERI